MLWLFLHYCFLQHLDLVFLIYKSWWNFVLWPYDLFRNKCIRFTFCICISNVVKFLVAAFVFCSGNWHRCGDFPSTSHTTLVCSPFAKIRQHCRLTVCSKSKKHDETCRVLQFTFWILYVVFWPPSRPLTLTLICFLFSFISPFLILHFAFFISFMQKF